MNQKTFQTSLRNLSSRRPHIGFYFSVYFLSGWLALWIGMGIGHFGLSLSLGGGMCAAGGLLGFLFGIPRVLQRTGKEPPSSSDPLTSSNTNLEQVSDWLTAIIIGASLVQLRDIGEGLNWLATKVSDGLAETGGSGVPTGTGYALGYFSIIYFSIGGFLFSYLFTRLNLSEAFSSHEANLRNAKKAAINMNNERDLLLREFERNLTLDQDIKERGLKISGDQNKGAFGGLRQANERTLFARISPLGEGGDLCRIDIEVTGSPANPLTGKVTFFLHETFKPNDRIDVIAVDNKASLTTISYGAFTVGAVADDGITRLELDLEDPDLGGPEKWRSR